MKCKNKLSSAFVYFINFFSKSVESDHSWRQVETLWPTHYNEFLRTIGIKEKKWPKSSVKKTKVFLWTCAFGAVYKSNTLFQKILFSWAASPVRTWYSFSRSSSRDKTLRKKVWEKLPKLICQHNHSFSCLQNFKTKLHYNTSNSMLFE